MHPVVDNEEFVRWLKTAPREELINRFVAWGVEFNDAAKVVSLGEQAILQKCCDLGVIDPWNGVETDDFDTQIRKLRAEGKLD